MTKPWLAEALGLEPHPEGGWYRETWRAPVEFTPPGYPGARAAATGIYFLLAPGEESAWHLVRSDELWLWHRGGPLALTTAPTAVSAPAAVSTPAAVPALAAVPAPAAVSADGPGAPHGDIVLGPDVEAGQLPQALVPGGAWQTARPLGSEPTLVSCVVAPGFDLADFRLL